MEDQEYAKDEREKLTGRTRGKVNLTGEAYAQKKGMLFFKVFQPGQQVPYRSLAKKLGMSLTPVVQALKHMEFLGLLRNEANRGFFVVEITPEEVREVYELREVLEAWLLPKVIANLCEKGERSLKTALDEYLEFSRRGFLKQRQEKDINFHLTLASISKQPICERILGYLLDFLYLRFEQEFIFSRPWDRADEVHRAIYKSVTERDVDAACDAMRNHLVSVKNNSLEGLENRLEELWMFESKDGKNNAA
jgi:DNA-binding GntR family transcriptional regulator